MKKQFLHEQHNRQDKAQKPDYREDLIEETVEKSSLFHMAMFKWQLSLNRQKLNVAEQMIMKYSRGAFHLGTREFRFPWGFKEYAKKNRIKPVSENSSTKEKQFRDADHKAFKRHKEMAERDFAKINDAIRLIVQRGGKLTDFVTRIRVESEVIIPEGEIRGAVPTPILIRR